MKSIIQGKPLGFKVRHAITGLYLTGGKSMPGKHFNRVGKVWPSMGHVLKTITLKTFSQDEEEDKLNWEIVPLVEGQAFTAAFFMDKILKSKKIS
jgi:hypothetical protein